MPSGVSTPWLIALLRKNTFAGSMNSDVSGSSEWSTRNCTALPSAPTIARTTGARMNIPTTAMIAAMMPAEKLSTSISKPGLTLPCTALSNFFMTHAVAGPMIMAPRNIGAAWPLAQVKIEAPALSTALATRVPLVGRTTPITEKAPTTPPRTSWTSLPPA